MTRFFAALLLVVSLHLSAQNIQPVSINMENFSYPYPVSVFTVHVENQELKMAYMNVAPPPGKEGNGKTVVLMHGKNFCSFYWDKTIKWFSELGYHVIAIDQLGFGKSSKPDIHYSLSLMAATTHQLLDSLHIRQIILVGHSTGGMLATRYALTYPDEIIKLILEDPIGMEDYRSLIPYDSLRNLYNEELHKPDEVTTKYIKAYFFEWNPDYEIYARIMNDWKRSPEYPRMAQIAASTTEMIYQQPVCYEFKNLKCPTLIIVGANDRTVIEKTKVPKNLLSTAGVFPKLAENAAWQMQKGSYEIILNCGHIPHIEKPENFQHVVLSYLTRSEVKSYDGITVHH
ncbi:MAG: Hydrolase, alpha/beta fold family protein [Bacteroidota bacterium]|nr:Hydrolase, alpha/beta fold family protein [Bacteroidota bacterium]